MTTKVLVVVEQGKDVKVEVQGRDSNGQFTQAAELIIEPGKVASFILHEGQQILVSESKD